VSRDKEAFDSYHSFCRMVNVRPMEYEQFCKVTQTMVSFNREAANEREIRRKPDNVRKQGAEYVICD
jgi:hypothetical protein